MENRNADIELRSEKVRNIVGKMPSVLVRYGTGIIALVLLAVVLGSYFFQFTPTYKTTAQIMLTPADTVINIHVPADVAEKIPVSSRAIISFTSISNLNVQNLFVSIEKKDSTMFIGQQGAYFLAECQLDNSSALPANTEIADTLFLNAEILGQKTTVFEWVAGKMRHKTFHAVKT